jgi:2-amino-4-hydroxy-6-hydroxymethyldihydropteridine diphosphokinase
MHSVIIAIGTNLGNRKENIETAIQKIKENGINIEKVSPIYETPPYGYTDQPAFLNCAVLAKTILSPHKLLDTLLSIEKEMGRVRKIHWGPRIIDLDIIFYDNLIIDEPDLKIPHPDMQNREFVLKPINDIAPCFVHPKFCKTVKTLYRELKSEKGTETP